MKPSTLFNWGILVTGVVLFGVGQAFVARFLKAAHERRMRIHGSGWGSSDKRASLMAQTIFTLIPLLAFGFILYFTRLSLVVWTGCTFGLVGLLHVFGANVGIMGLAKNEVEDVWLSTHGLDKKLDGNFVSYPKAADRGDAEAQCLVGGRYFMGQGVSQNYTEAAKWFRKAADQGLAEGQSNLGDCYAFGEGVAVDQVEAVNWWRKAAEQGLAGAQYNLVVCYANGTGAPKDDVEAYKWASLAAAQGNDDAVVLEGLLARRMSPKQVAEGQRRATALWAKRKAAGQATMNA